MKGLSEGAGAKMDNNVPPAPGCDSGVICCSKGLSWSMLSVNWGGRKDRLVCASINEVMSACPTIPDRHRVSSVLMMIADRFDG